MTCAHESSANGISRGRHRSPTVADMRILLVGATGTLGTALHKELSGRGHEVLAVARTGGDLRYDVTDPAQVTAMYDRAGPLDAVVSAAGHVPYKPVVEMTPEDYL